MGASALRVTGAEKHYGGPGGGSGRAIFQNINLDVAEGETLVLLGPSGCGKSTFLRVLAGLEPASAGSVAVTLPTAPGGRSPLGLVFQDPLLLPWLTVRENVALGLQYRANRQAAASADVDGLLAEFGLDGLGDLLPTQLSGGQAQRVSLARTVVTGPRILLLDEPFGALDPRTRASLQTWLKTVKAHFNLTVVLVTHDLDEALALGDRIVLFSAAPGRIVANWQVAEAASDASRQASLRNAILDRYEDATVIPLRSAALAAAV